MSLARLNSAEAISSNGNTAVSAALDLVGAKGIVVGVAHENPTTATVTDDSLNTYTPRGTFTSGAIRITILDSLSPAVDSSVIITGLATSGFPYMMIGWYSATGTMTFIAVSAGGGVGAGTTAEPGSLDADGADTLFTVFAGVDDDLETGYSVDDGFSDLQEELEAGNNYGGFFGDKLSATAENPTVTADAAVQNMAVLMTNYKDVGGGGGGGGTVRLLGPSILVKSKLEGALVRLHNHPEISLAAYYRERAATHRRFMEQVRRAA